MRIRNLVTLLVLSLTVSCGGNSDPSAGRVIKRDYISSRYGDAYTLVLRLKDHTKVQVVVEDWEYDECQLGEWYNPKSTTEICEAS